MTRKTIGGITFFASACILAGALATSFPAECHGRMIEGRLTLIYFGALLLDAKGTIEVIDIKSVGRSGLSYNEHIRVHYTREIAGVKIAERIEQRPLVKVDPVHIVTTDDLTLLVNSRSRYTLIDSRPKDDYDAGHLPSALSIPYARFDKYAHVLPADRESLIVFYSGSPRCPLAAASREKALRRGYRNIKIYQEGEYGWVKADNYSVAEPEYVWRKMQQDSPLLLVDVRPLWRAESSHIPGAVSKPFADMNREDFLNGFWEEPIVFYGEDESDAGACNAANKALLWGYHYESNSNAPVKVMNGGLKAWKAKGYEAPSGPMHTSIKYGPRRNSGEISFEEFRRLWENRSRDPLLLDVAGGRAFDWVTSIPYDELPKRLNELPRDREIIAFCVAGYRANIAYHILKKNGYRVRMVKHDVNILPDGTLL